MKRQKLMTNHATSSYGVPVFVDSKNNVIDYNDGIKILRHGGRMNTDQFGELVGVSGRTVESWEQGLRLPSKSVLLLMQKLF